MSGHVHDPRSPLPHSAPSGPDADRLADEKANEMASASRSWHAEAASGRRTGRAARPAAAPLAAFAVLTALMPGAAARAVEPGPDARLAAVGAALVYNIARFSTWSSAAGDTFDICLADEDVLPAFKAIEDREVGGRAVRVKAVAPGDVQLASCEVYFLSDGSERDAIDETPYGTLTVSTRNGILHEGGAVRIGLDGDRPAFGFNVSNAAKAGVEPSSQLLQLAEEVIR